jgi:hydrogenase maturation protease
VKEVLVLGIGNVLWADEGFGVRAVEALHEAYECPAGVELLDGGTQGLYLLEHVCSAQRLIVFDAIDYGLPPATLKVLRDDDVPAWGAAKVSLHQTNFQELLALARLQGRAPERLTLIGVQPEDLSDFGGSLRASVRARLPEAVAVAVQELTDWGYAPRGRTAQPVGERLNAAPLAIEAYESGRPPAEHACRIGDARFLNIRARAVAPRGEGRAGTAKRER